MVGPIESNEVREQMEWWTRRAQEATKGDPRLQTDQETQNLKENELNILECRRRIIGEYPTYIPDFHPLGMAIVRAHLVTLHVGVGMTMAKVRERYWIPRLRRLFKKG